MTEQQTNEFDRWFEQFMDPELNLTPGEKELCRHAWQAALSHAEEEATAWLEPAHELDDNSRSGCITNERKQELLSKGGMIAASAENYSVPLYTHPAPQVVFSDTQEEIEARLADQLENSCPYCRGSGHKDDVAAPQVAVPEEVAQALAGMMAIVRDSRGVAGYHLNGDIAEWDEFDEVAAAEVALAETPTAPAGEPECCRSKPCKRPGTGPCDMPATEQPVSDPDGLPEPGRREAEQAYINGAFDYARDPIGSRDWVLFWNGWQARDKSAPSPDERDIAALLERIVPRIDPQNPKPLDKSEHCCECTLYYERERIHDEIARLRAGQEGKDHA